VPKSILGEQKPENSFNLLNIRNAVQTPF